jgi:hypothetical protein
MEQHLAAHAELLSETSLSICHFPVHHYGGRHFEDVFVKSWWKLLSLLIDPLTICIATYFISQVIEEFG